ncbi:response regulator transcription factor [Amycolatopsis mongoliensis]|uniref:Response regulator transcription factor n=1 Tax=Amycolatopsis mongoliensis TaxID=715475 RepID=A0A9Y2JNZ1_9PSEU|nr:response regulator transcription factor [Amycolatopsis sp. 4-36]WIY00862.1 response regulator transcription factor [Amycolatopsis sp. 4-36]
MHCVTTLVVDDQPVLRYAVRQLLQDYAGVRVVTEAGTEREALRQCEKNHPDMVITELSISGEPAGAGICQFAKEHLEGAVVLVFAGDSSPAAVATALNAGADSFVHKSVSGARLVAAVRSTLAGGRVWVPAGETTPLLADAVPHANVMTKREEDILALMLCRWSNDEIAGELHLARQTVKNYSSRILHKLGFASRRELVHALGSRAGQVRLEGPGRPPGPAR